MQDFTTAMAWGCAQYQDVIDILATSGYPATFTQTGGMNAGLEVLLEGGWALLITDACESLSWVRSEKQGWGVGLYAPDEQYDTAPRAFAETPQVDTGSLMELVRHVLREGAGNTGRAR